MIKTRLIMLPILLLVACSDDQNKVEEHVWKEQTELIDKAKDVEKTLSDAALEQQKSIKEQAR